MGQDSGVKGSKVEIVFMESDQVSNVPVMEVQVFSNIEVGFLEILWRRLDSFFLTMHAGGCRC